jgi:hypothetical protein
MSCMATTTRTMVVKFSHNVFVSLMRWLFHEAMTSLFLPTLSPPRHKKSYVTLRGTTWTTYVYQSNCSYRWGPHTSWPTSQGVAFVDFVYNVLF